MKYESVTEEEFAKILTRVCARDTSADPEHWSAESPLWGHCAVVALLVQDQFGGTLMRQSLKTVTEFEYLRYHYLNKLPDGTEVDFTQEQFHGTLPKNLLGEERSRERVLEHPDTVRRYELLKRRFESEV